MTKTGVLKESDTKCISALKALCCLNLDCLSLTLSYVSHTILRTTNISIPQLYQIDKFLTQRYQDPSFTPLLEYLQPCLEKISVLLPFHCTMNSSNNPHDSDSDSSVDSISRYGGYKYSFRRYEDFEMWNSPCEDAELGWTYKEAQRQAKKQEKEAKKEVARKELEKKEKEEQEKSEAAEVRKKEKAAEVAQRQARPDTAAITELGSPFNPRSNHAARHRTQSLARILHNNTEELDAVLAVEHDKPKFEYDVQSRQELALDLEQLHVVLVALLKVLRSEDVNEQPPPASEPGSCVSM